MAGQVRPVDRPREQSSMALMSQVGRGQRGECGVRTAGCPEPARDRGVPVGGWCDRLVREGAERLGGGKEGLGMTFQAILYGERAPGREGQETT